MVVFRRGDFCVKSPHKITAQISQSGVEQMIDEKLTTIAVTAMVVYHTEVTCVSHRGTWLEVCFHDLARVKHFADYCEAQGYTVSYYVTQKSELRVTVE